MATTTDSITRPQFEDDDFQKIYAKMQSVTRIAPLTKERKLATLSGIKQLIEDILASSK